VDRHNSASSHGPTRKLTDVGASVKRNVVNTNVYKTENSRAIPIFVFSEVDEADIASLNSRQLDLDAVMYGSSALCES
jgi:hypothetical protein